MKVTVNFRGPILFVHDGTTLKDVRIPDSRTAPTHKDGTTATAHKAGILVVWHASGQEEHFELVDKVLTIKEDGATKPPSVQTNFRDKVLLEQLVNADVHNGQELKLGETTSAELLAQIFLVGGKLTSAKHTTDKFDVPYRLGGATKKVSLPLLTTLTCNDTVTITGAESPIKLEKEDRAYVYNWDYDQPTEADLLYEMKSTTGETMEPESDFKWLYMLVEPPSTWADWLTNNTTDGLLPAPFSEIVKRAHVADINRFPPNSACDGGTWKEPP